MLKLVVLQFYNFNNDKTVSPHFVADKKKKKEPVHQISRKSSFLCKNVNVYGYPYNSLQNDKSII